MKKFLVHTIKALSIAAAMATTEGCEAVDCDAPLNIAREVHGQAEGAVPCLAGVYAEGFETTGYKDNSGRVQKPEKSLAMCTTKEEAAEILKCDTVSSQFSPCDIVREALYSELNPTNSPKVFLAFPQLCWEDDQFVCAAGASYGEIFENTGFYADDIKNVVNSTVEYFCRKNGNDVDKAANEIW